MADLNNIKNLIAFLEKSFTIFAVQMTVFKILNYKVKFSLKNVFGCLSLVLLCFVVQILNSKIDFLYRMIILIFLQSCISTVLTKRNLGTNIVLVTISLALNYAILFMAIIIVFFINNKLIPIENDIISFLIIILIDVIILGFLFKSKRLKYGVISLQNNISNDYVELIILSISIGILYIGMIFYDMQIFVIRDFMFIFIV